MRLILSNGGLDVMPVLVGMDRAMDVVSMGSALKLLSSATLPAMRGVKTNGNDSICCIICMLLLGCG